MLSRTLARADNFCIFIAVGSDWNEHDASASRDTHDIVVESSGLLLLGIVLHEKYQQYCVEVPQVPMSEEHSARSYDGISSNCPPFTDHAIEGIFVFMIFENLNKP